MCQRVFVQPTMSRGLSMSQFLECHMNLSLMSDEKQQSPANTKQKKIKISEMHPFFLENTARDWLRWLAIKF